jgi:glutathione peroxidase-family protein
MKMLPKCRCSPQSLILVAALAGPAQCLAQDLKAAPAQGPKAASIEAINAGYSRQLAALERQRLEQLGELAAGQPKAEADATHREYFQLAIAKDLYPEAEATARRLIEAGDSSSELRTLAHLVKIVAEAERGAYDDSLKSLLMAVGEKASRAKPAGAPGRDLGLTAASRAAIIEAYYQKLIRGNQYGVARKAMQVVAENAENPAVRDLAARRGRHLEMIGQPAPSIVSVDLEGKPFRLEDTKGEVVLLFFWASWCLPAAEQIPPLEETFRAYRDRGFRVVGIDVDSIQDGETDPKTIAANARRFLVEFNIPWTTLINGRGDQDLTRSYTVTEIPANVLIGRDGKVIHLDLFGPKLDKAVAEAVAAKP